MKILYITNHLKGTDGWSRYSRDLVIAMKGLGNECVAVIMKGEKDNSAPIKQYELLRSPLKYSNRPGRLLFDKGKLKEIIRYERPDIIHYAVEHYTLFNFFLPKHIKKVLTIHGTYAIRPLASWKTRALSDAYYHSVDMVISVSHFTKKRLVDLMPWVHSKITVVQNGIKLADSNEDDIMSKMDSRRITFVGHIKPRKGILETIEALGAYKRIYKKEFFLHIIGKYNSETEYWKKITQRILELDLKDNIEIHGCIEDRQKNEMLKNSDLFIMLSKVSEDNFEGFGLVYLEANQYGVPTIGSNEGGPAEAIKDGFSGFTVDASNEEDVAKKIHMVLDKRVIQKKDCINWAKEHDIINKAPIIEEIYQSILK